MKTLSLILITLFVFHIANATIDMEGNDLCPILYKNCKDCLQKGHSTGCGWCASSKTCVSGDSHGPTEGTCDIWESHGIGLTANDCCSDQSDCSGCLEATRQSYCSWCPGNTLLAEEPKCFYSYDKSTRDEQCHAVADTATCCSNIDNCRTCTSSAHPACTWCDDGSIPGHCIMKYPDFEPDQEYRCGANYTSCCDGVDCSSCSEEAGPRPFAPDCVWCESSQECQRIEQENCTFSLTLGETYCSDPCYSKYNSCGPCVSNVHCIWVDDVAWHGDDEGSLHPIADSFCIGGSLFGPESDEIEYRLSSSSTLGYRYDAARYYWGFCEIEAHVVITILKSLIIAILGGLLIAYIAIKSVQRSKYSKIVRAAEESARQREANRQLGGGELNLGEDEGDIFSLDAFQLAMQCVPWED
eukprot:gnl/Dysnectes_brevis/1098_a1229_2937.p1 GENE.gnl/Dysnectes_brevis/1098_a1229_2937~~gnl/Dysnectes_brevis/1098_a1229_2937.p1  ORF type:complete len:413 (+),score=101.62 gnl/Dysnectes_brevis/1098_a1229_2937:21-1259(+)